MASTMDAVARMPSLAYERDCWACGDSVAGIDEVGRGAWAGPVVAAAVILPANSAIETLLTGVRDSKELTPRARERLAAIIRAHALAVGVGSAPAGVVDGAGLLPATARAMNAALAALPCAPDRALVDGLPMRGLSCPHTAIVKGDAACLSIAAASIVAKVTRDRWMAALEQVYAGYSFADHKGYGSAAHRAALRQLGVCAEHRLSFRPVAEIVAQSWV